MKLDEIKIRLLEELKKDSTYSVETVSLRDDLIISSLQSEDEKIKYLEGLSGEEIDNFSSTIKSLSNKEEKIRFLRKQFEYENLGLDFEGFVDLSEKSDDGESFTMQDDLIDSGMEHIDMNFLKDITTRSTLEETLRAIYKEAQYQEFLEEHGDQESEGNFKLIEPPETFSEEEKLDCLKRFWKMCDSNQEYSVLSIFQGLIISKFTEEDIKLAEALLEELSLRRNKEVGETDKVALEDLSLEELQKMSAENERKIANNDVKLREALINRIRTQQATIQSQENELESLNIQTQKQEHGEQGDE